MGLILDLILDLIRDLLMMLRSPYVTYMIMDLKTISNFRNCSKLWCKVIKLTFEIWIIIDGIGTNYQNKRKKKYLWPMSYLAQTKT